MAAKKKVRPEGIFLVVFPSDAFTEDTINVLKQEFDEAGVKLILAKYNKLSKSLPEFIQIEV